MLKNWLFLKWLLFFSGISVVSVFGVFLGAPVWIYRSDPTGISFGIYTLAFGMMLWLGGQFWVVGLLREYPHNARKHAYIARTETIIRHGEYASELCQILGLLGTIIGFVKLLVVFNGLTSVDQDKIATLIQSVGSNLGIAFVTTLVGTIASMVVSFQVHWLTTALPQEDDDVSKS